MADTQEVQIKITADTSGADKSVGSIKKQLREATADLLRMRDQFGETSDEAVAAAKKVANLRDEIGDAKALTDAFNPDAKFKAFGAALQGVAGGFAAVQGAQALFGSESKELEKTLVKVQGALALSQGVDAILEAGDAFKNLKTVAIDAFKGIKTAIGSTGIGLLVIALGAIYAYWDDIKEAVGGVSAEQAKLNKSTQENLAIQEKKLESIDAQDNILKLQGKSEKDILKIKIAQTDEVIKATEANINNLKITKTEQVKIAERNKEILKGLLNLLSLPITAILFAVDKTRQALGQTSNLLDDYKEGLANLVFDPKKVSKEADEAIAEAEKGLTNLKNQRAGYQLQVQAIDKDASDKRKAKNDENNKKQLEANAQLQKQIDALNEESFLKSIKDDDERATAKIELERKRKVKEIEAGAGSEKLKAQLIAEVNAKAEADKLLVTDAAEKKRQELILANDKRTNDLISQQRLAALTDEFAKKQFELTKNQEAEIDAELDLLNKKLISKEEFELNKSLIDARYKGQRDALSLEENQKELNNQLALLGARANNNQLSIDQRRDALAQQQLLIDENYKNNILKEEAYNAKSKELSDARIQLDNAEAKAREDNLAKISGLLGNLADLVGKQTGVGKAFAIAQATIDTYLSATKAYQSLSGIPVVGPALGAVAAGAAIASGIKNVKSILAVKVPGGAGGGSAPSGGSVPNAPSVQAPIQPQLASTLINQAQVNQIGSAAARAYVVESDVSGNQERIQRINRAARIS